MITTRKIKLIPRDNEFYSFFRKEQREQNKALNMAIGYIHTSNILNSVDSGAEARIQKSISKLQSKIDKLNLELKKDKITEKKKESTLKAINTNEELLQGELQILEEGLQFRQGLDKKFKQIYIDKNNLYQLLNKQTQVSYMSTLDMVIIKATDDHKNNFTDIMTGKSSLMNYRNDCPLMIRKECIKIHNEDNQYSLGIMLGYEFDIVLGRRDNENINELKATLDKCIEGEYSICQSSIQFDKKKNIIINLVLDIPKSNGYTYIEGRTLGVDLGLNVPAYMSLGDDTYKKEAIGNINQFLKVREQMQDRKSKLQKSLTTVKGGKGRERKLQALTKLRECESNYCKTFNHSVSKRIVQFAKKYKCQYINMEKLEKDGFPNQVLRNWSFYQLREMVKYKAKREGIELRLVDPAYTSQTCSRCGNIDSDNRPKKEKGQAYFKCTKCEFELNADHNAAINIARSSSFIK